MAFSKRTKRWAAGGAGALATAGALVATRGHLGRRMAAPASRLALLKGLRKGGTVGRKAGRFLSRRLKMSPKAAGVRAGLRSLKMAKRAGKR